MLCVAICDDEKLHREHTARLVGEKLASRCPEIDCFDSAEALLRAMEAGDYAPEIAILDIQMGETDGIALARRLNVLAPECRIIFLTSFLEYATDVYETQHAYFIIKSELERRIGPALERALSSHNDPEPSIRYKSGAAARVLPMREVLYLERRLHRTRIVKFNGEDWTATPPKELLSPLPQGHIIHCHQSFWVNKTAIFELCNNEFVLINGARLPISRTFKNEAREAFFGSLFPHDL